MPDGQLPDHVCWCCAMWGLVAAGTVQPDGLDPGWLCDSCDAATPEQCNLRHMRQADAAAVQVQARRRSKLTRIG